MAKIRIEDTEIHYEWHPGTKGRNVAFLNGVMASIGSWETYSALFRSLGYGVLLHDFRGQLLSGKPEGPYTFKEHARDLDVLRNHLDIDSLHLVGTSYGGEVALKYAADYPDRTDSLSVIDSVSETDALLKSFIDSWILLARSGDPVTFYWSVVPSLYSSGFLETRMDMLKERASVFSRLPGEYFTGQAALYESFRNIDLTPELAHIKSPACIICGTADILKPPKFSRIIADGIEDSRLILLPDCGHVAIFERVESLKVILTGFISNISRE